MGVTVLLRSRRRMTIARGYEQVLADVRRPPRGFTARVPVLRGQVVAAAPEIERLIDRLRDVERPVGEDAVAQASALICDGGGPFYEWAEPGTVRRRVAAILQAME